MSDELGIPIVISFAAFTLSVISYITTRSISKKQLALAETQKEIAKQQTKIAQNQNQIALYERRFEVYVQSLRILKLAEKLSSSSFLKKGTPSIDLYTLPASEYNLIVIDGLKRFIEEMDPALIKNQKTDSIDDLKPMLSKAMKAVGRTSYLRNEVTLLFSKDIETQLHRCNTKYLSLYAKAIAENPNKTSLCNSVNDFTKTCASFSKEYIPEMLEIMRIDH